jgi:hypothetical protein
VKTVACEVMTVLAMYTISYVNLLIFTLQTTLEKSGFLAPGPWSDIRHLDPNRPPLPAPYQVLGLEGSASKGPLRGKGTGDTAAQSMEMLEDDLVVPETDNDNED